MMQTEDRERTSGGGHAEVQSRIEVLETEIAALKARWPAHSVPPALWQELEELEDELGKLKAGA